MRNGCVLLKRQMSIPFVEKNILPNQIGFSKSRFYISELECNFLVNIAAVPVLMNARQIRLESVIDRCYRFKPFVLDFNQIHSIERCVFVDGGNRSNRITDETDFINAQSVF